MWNEEPEQVRDIVLENMNALAAEAKSGAPIAYQSSEIRG
jgi:hypothetical protein